jgi:AbrB family looped-hinge helix DNA binding protein
METTLDRFGRIIIPKNVRDDMGLEVGVVLQIETKGEKIVLQPVQGEPKIIAKKGILVFTGTAVGDVGAALQEHRKRRLKKDGREGLEEHENRIRHIHYRLRNR